MARRDRVNIKVPYTERNYKNELTMGAQSAN